MIDFEEQQWILAAQIGNQDAFAELVRLYEKRVFALTSRMCKNHTDAEEAAQETFLAAWQGLPHFRGESAFSTWLYRLASNACIDVMRREGRHRASAGPSFNDEELNLEIPDDHNPSPQEFAERKELQEQVESGLAALSPQQREVLILRELHQQSYDEISHILSLDVGTVKSRINRGRKQLRNFLLKKGNFFDGSPSKKDGKEGCP